MQRDMAHLRALFFSRALFFRDCLAAMSSSTALWSAVELL